MRSSQFACPISTHAILVHHLSVFYRDHNSSCGRAKGHDSAVDNSKGRTSARTPGFPPIGSISLIRQPAIELAIMWGSDVQKPAIGGLVRSSRSVQARVQGQVHVTCVTEHGCTRDRRRSRPEREPGGEQMGRDKCRNSRPCISPHSNVCTSSWHCSGIKHRKRSSSLVGSGKVRVPRG
jgi:hypothetical protein